VKAKDGRWKQPAGFLAGLQPQADADADVINSESPAAMFPGLERGLLHPGGWCAAPLAPASAKDGGCLDDGGFMLVQAARRVPCAPVPAYTTQIF
jgi:hypothetical protein